ncbi:hypothetical protein ACTFIR_007913 [Dictyostelium discoideum]
MKKPYNKKVNVNKCMANDLVITFPMRDEQIIAKLDSIKRWKYVHKNLYSIDDFCSLLNEFEMIQLSIGGNSLFNKYNGKQYNYLKEYNLTSTYFKMIQRERDFSVLTSFKSDIINNGIPKKSNGLRTQILGKLNDDGSPIFKKDTIFNRAAEELIIDMKENKAIEVRHEFFRDVDFNRLNRKTNKIGENWVTVDKFPFGSLVIPKFKEICHSVLKELFLINRDDTLIKINSLPEDILIGFIDSCFNDKTPVGKEILFELFKNHILNNNNNKTDDEIESLFPIERIINSCIIRDDWFRFNYGRSIAQNLFLPHFQDGFSINVYENYQLFTHKNIEKLSDNLLLKHTNSKKSESMVIGESSIVSKEKFIENFHLVTNNMFNDFSKIPKTCYFIGGILTACLTDSINEDEYKDSDIDVCFTGHESYDIVEFIETYFGSLGELQTDKTTTIHGDHLTISKYYPNRHVQINLHFYPTLESILVGVDIDASCFAFNGKDLYCLERAIHSINYSINIACEFNFNVRGNGHYQKRLVKYLDRGFHVYYLPTPQINYFFTDIILSVSENDGFSPTLNQNGIALLASASLSKQILKELKKPSFSIPYGPSYDKKSTDLFIRSTYKSMYNGYSTPMCHRIIDTVGEGEDSINTILFETRSIESLSLNKYSWEQHITNETLRSNLFNYNQFF